MRRNGRSSADLHDPSAGTGLAGRLVPCPNGRNPTTPPSPDEGQPIAIALSGGGFRATLTALGALRLLQDADLLKQVRYVSSVSGGSIAAALVATRWDETLDVGLDAAVIDPLVHDISTRSLTATIVKNLWRTLGDTSRTDLLARILDEWWFDGATLEELAEPIRWIINATNQNTASRFGFERDRLGDYISGEISTRGLRIGVATAVAASAAVPGLFPPLQLAPDIRFACPDVGAPRLIDGGTYDNTGLTAIEHHTYDDTLTFALNAGGTFTIGAYGKLPIVRDLQTANSILYRQTNTLRQQDFKIRNWRFQQALAAGADERPTGARAAIGVALATEFDADAGNYDEWQQRFARIRTWADQGVERDLAFVPTTFSKLASDTCRRLVYNGWWLAGAAIASHYPQLLEPADLTPPPVSASP